jgi:hypothetical protein
VLDLAGFDYDYEDDDEDDALRVCRRFTCGYGADRERLPRDLRGVPSLVTLKWFMSNPAAKRAGSDRLLFSAALRSRAPERDSGEA